jgi:hypothetical protein
MEKNPKIALYVTDTYSYHPQQNHSEYDDFHDQEYLFYQDGKVLYYYEMNDILSSPMKPGKYLLTYGDVALEFHSGYQPRCRMYVSSETINQLALEENTPIDPVQELLIMVMKTRVASFRKKQFFEELNGASYALNRDHINFEGFLNKDRKGMVKIMIDKYNKSYDEVLLSLQAHGLAKVSSNGAAGLTLEGKNMSIKIKDKYEKAVQEYYTNKEYKV